MSNVLLWTGQGALVGVFAVIISSGRTYRWRRRAEHWEARCHLLEARCQELVCEIVDLEMGR
jgi:hypothetical protein